jgi:hypothetical protein
MRHAVTAGLRLSVVVAFAFATIGAATASATMNPTFGECKETPPGAGLFTDVACTAPGPGSWEAVELKTPAETMDLEEVEKSSQKFHLGGAFSATVACKKVTLAKGAKAFGGEPGIVEESRKYEGCSVEHMPGCEINKEAAGKAKITSAPLVSALVFITKKGAEKKNPEETGMLTNAKAGKGSPLLTFELSGACPGVGKFDVTGQFLAKNVKAGKHTEKQALSAPAKRLTKYYFNKEEGKPPKEEAPEPPEIKLPKGAKLEVIDTGLEVRVCITFQNQRRRWWVIN